MMAHLRCRGPAPDLEPLDAAMAWVLRSLPRRCLASLAAAAVDLLDEADAAAEDLEPDAEDEGEPAEASLQAEWCPGARLRTDGTEGRP